MRPVRALLAALLGSVALVVAGCSSSNAATTAPDASSLAPRDAGALVVVDTDLASTQWRNAQTLLARIPGASKAVNGALSQIGGVKGLDVTKDVGPALGTQLVVVVPAGARHPVLLVRPDDSKKLDALLAKGTKRHVTGDVDGWTAVATTQKELDAYRSALAKGALAGSSAYAKATAGLPGESLARGYVSGAGLAKVMGSAAGMAQSLAGSGRHARSSSAGRAASPIGTIGFAISATEHAFRLDGSLLAKNDVAATSFTPTLLAKVPADALAALTFDGAGRGRKLIDQALKQGGTQLATVEKQLGVKLGDLVAALDGEGVLYVRAGALVPEITLAVRPQDAAQARATFETLAAKLGQGAGGAALPLPGFKLTVTTANGVVLVSTAAAVASTFGSGPGLTSTARFRAAARDVGFHGKTGGLLYVDVHALGPLLQLALGAFGGGGSGATANGLEGLSAFDTAIVGSTVDGSRTRFAAVINLG
jgi:hypothetical protein